jgi:hypothetical protein
MNDSTTDFLWTLDITEASTLVERVFGTTATLLPYFGPLLYDLK